MAGCDAAPDHPVTATARTPLPGLARSPGTLTQPTQILQPVLTQIAKPAPVRQPVSQQLARPPGHQNLTAMADREQPGGPVHHRTGIIAVTLHTSTRTQRHAYKDLRPGRPPLSTGSPLKCTRSEERRVGKECRARVSPQR